GARAALREQGPRGPGRSERTWDRWTDTRATSRSAALAPGVRAAGPSGRREADERFDAAARVEAHAAAVSVVPGDPAVAAALDVLRLAHEPLHLGARHAALHGAERLEPGTRLRLAVARL